MADETDATTPAATTPAATVPAAASPAAASPAATVPAAASPAATVPAAASPAAPVAPDGGPAPAATLAAQPAPATTPAGDADEHRDELPEELDASGYVGPYTFPNNNRRRVSGLIFTAAGVICIALYVIRGSGVLVNRGLFYGGLFLLALACYHFVSGVTLRIDETDALVAATKTVGFTVGHASAQLSWRGLISHPTWRILLYSADDPPKKRALVLVDGVLGTVGDHLVEDNPEDWSSMDR